MMQNCAGPEWFWTKQIEVLSVLSVEFLLKMEQEETQVFIDALLCLCLVVLLPFSPHSKCPTFEL